MKLEYAALTDVGMKRPHNEDNYLVDEKYDLYIVCDGMGGHEKGEVASQIAVSTIKQFFEENEKDPYRTWLIEEDATLSKEANILRAGIVEANNNIFKASGGSSGVRKMGTTVVALVRTSKGLAIAHVGDSRCYRVRGGRLNQMTTDHSLLNSYLQQANLTEEQKQEEIKNFQYKNIILRALGMKSRVEVDVQEVVPEEGDIYLLCSDGLSGEVDDPQIEEIINKYEDDLHTAVRELINKANAHGGKDNITAILVKVVEK